MPGTMPRRGASSGFCLSPRLRTPLPARGSSRPTNAVSMGVWQPLAPLVGAALLAGGVDRAAGLSLRGVSWFAAVLAAAQVAAGATLLADPLLLGSLAGICGVVATIAGAAWNGPGADDADFEKAFGGKVVWITGASSGIGEALVYAFHKAGARVVLSARRVSELERVRDACVRESGGRGGGVPLILPLDLSKPGEMKGKAEEATAALAGAGIDLLVHNGGKARNQVSSRALAEEMDWELDQVQGLVGLPARTAYRYVRTALSLNAVTGTGAKHGVMDAATEKGMDPAVFAKKTLAAIARKDSQ
ncbi:hypothetical protein T484DRAFT_1978539, partial [Baffinella frigidus]